MTTKARLVRFARRKRRAIVRAIAAPALLGAGLGGFMGATLPATKAAPAVNVAKARPVNLNPREGYEPLPASFWYVPVATIPEDGESGLLDRPEIEGAPLGRKPAKIGKAQGGSNARGMSFPKAPKLK